MNKKIKVVELFAGVGGFRLGLERASNLFETIWANQWEPLTKVQHAADIYKKHWRDDTLINEDINTVWQDIPNHDLLVGGFPCQDYSVAHGNKSQGIKGKKGVLWWVIHKIIKKREPSMILLENVDRLLKSPTLQRGRDFAIMLRSLSDLGYVVEWRIINAADYGFPQKRKRVFIFAHKYSINNITEKKWLEMHSILTKAFPVKEFHLFRTHKMNKKRYKNLVDLTDEYGEGKFWESGIIIKNEAISARTIPIVVKQKNFKNILDKKRGNYVFLSDEQFYKAEYTKSHKKIERTKIVKNGDKKMEFGYFYTEGKMSFPDNLNLPARTMLTSEGTINRSSHFIKYGKKVRFITPIEAERLNGFPDNWTEGKANRFRFFAMGNALVIGIIQKIGEEIIKQNRDEYNN